MVVIFLHFSSLYLSSYLFPVFIVFALGLGVHIVLVAGVIFLSLSLSLFSLSMHISIIVQHYDAMVHVFEESLFCIWKFRVVFCVSFLVFGVYIMLAITQPTSHLCWRNLFWTITNIYC